MSLSLYLKNVLTSIIAQYNYIFKSIVNSGKICEISMSQNSQGSVPASRVFFFITIQLIGIIGL